jgi:hypothetical protein
MGIADKATAADWQELSAELERVKGSLEQLSEKLNDPDALKRMREGLLAERAHGVVPSEGDDG